tara:strand:+ start:55 stop:477 length:423 start_codon:yes stop_codon:yes gene_type:complete
MSELEFKKTGKGLTIKDKATGKPFGAIVPKPAVDKVGNKFELRVTAGIPKSIREELDKERKEKKQVTAGQAKFLEKFSIDKNKVSKVHTKTMSDAKKMALKISKVGGGGDFPIKIEQGPDLVKDKKKFSSGGIVNFKGIF